MKIHLLDTELPIIEGSDLTVNCGAIIPKASAVRLSAEDVGDEFLHSRTICKNCRRAFNGKHYLYGILTGQEQLQESA